MCVYSGRLEGTVKKFEKQTETVKSNIATLPDLVVMSLAITDAHDASIRAAEHSTS